MYENEKEVELMNKIVFFTKKLSDIEHYNDKAELLRSKITKEQVNSFLKQLKN